MLDAVTKTIEVPCSQEKAFGVFVNETTHWWPLGKHTVSAQSGAVAKSVSIEPKQGGKIVEIGHDDKEHLWGTVMSYDPHGFFSMGFHPGFPASESASLVEVRFKTLGIERTRVQLTHSNWEAFGEMAADMRAGFGAGWGHIFEEVFKSACGG